METRHQIYFSDARNLKDLKNESINLVVTSPPYPMIEMWDEIFSQQNPEIKKALKNTDGNTAFELMHNELQKVWSELYRVVKPGGIVCITVGDATRTLNSVFKLFSNHSRILRDFIDLGFNNLPNILWRKQTNAPNKFMGSGTLPPGAYVTLEHEHILIFRKGNKRMFKSDQEKSNRQESAFFWEERNVWFSDLWELKGTQQNILNEKTRMRSGAFPFELAYRLVNMFSLKEDIVLDPFLGTGTTTFAAIAAGRNSIGIELDKEFEELINAPFKDLEKKLNMRIRKRFQDHLDFVKQRKEQKGNLKHTNQLYGFSVMTAQEKKMFINFVDRIRYNSTRNEIKVSYIDRPIIDKFS